MRRLLGAAALCAACFTLAAAPAQAQAPSAHRVAVTQPDELGQPVEIDTDVYLPPGSPPASGWPVVIYHHGGGGSKSGGFEVDHATEFVRHGYAVILFSARGHGDSDGQTAVAGPKEMRDLFDVTDWALGEFPIDRERIALGGESQGGLYTNGGQLHSSEPDVNPYGIRFKALIPGNTPDYVYEALVPNGVVKLSFGVGLIQTYVVGAQAQVSPLVQKWIAAVSTDRPEVAGADLCDTSVHDTTTSPTKADLAYRSPGCHVDRMTIPTLWAQAFDDGLFTPEMAISMWRRMPNPANRLYLDMGGHAAPSTTAEVAADELAAQVEFLDSILKPGAAGGGPGADQGTPGARTWAGKKLHTRGKRKLRKAKRLKRKGHLRRAHRQHRRGKRMTRRARKLFAQSPGSGGSGGGGGSAAAQSGAQPEVVYWRRDPRVLVPSTSFSYPQDAWARFESPGWPPPGTSDLTLQLGSDGNAVGSGAATGALPLAPLTVDLASDPVAYAALSATPIGTSPIPSQIPGTNSPGFVAGFSTAAFGADAELAGQPSASLAWTPLSPDTQLVLRVFDRAPDGKLTLLSRGVTGVRDATPAVQQQVRVTGNAMSSLIPEGHTLLTWVSASELSFYKPYAGSLGGALGAGPTSTLTLPIRSP